MNTSSFLSHSNSKVSSSCPVCSKEGVGGKGLKECPQCHSNLHVFSIVDELSQPPTDPSHTTQIKSPPSSPQPSLPTYTTAVTHPSLWTPEWALKLILGLSLIVFGFLALILYFYQAQTNHQMTLLSQINGDVVQILKSNIQTNIQTNLQNHLIEPIQGEEERPVRDISDIGQTQQNNGYHEYIFAEGDTLWSLAEKHWQQGLYYPVLLDHNPWLSLSSGNEGFRIRIINDVEQVRREYADLVVHISGVTFFKHQVRPQDTWEKIAKNFLGKEEEASLLEQLNSGRLDPGNRILVPIKK